MGYRYRRMYYATGLPGWIRFGYSPGWIGRSPTGLPPTAEWIVSSGLLPQFSQWLGTRASLPLAPPTVVPTVPTGAPMTREQEIQMLEQQAKSIEAQLEATRKRLEALRQRPADQQDAQPYYPYLPPVYGYPPIPYTPPSPEEELASLQSYRKGLEEEMKSVDARIEELKKLREKKVET